MRRQTNLLSFLNPCGTKHSDKRSLSTGTPSTSVVKTKASTPSPHNDAESIIADTPEPPRIATPRSHKCVSDFHESPVLTDRPTFQMHLTGSTKTKQQILSKHRPSAFVRERQLRLQEKYSQLLMSHDGPTLQHSDERSRLSAKLRRGNYDELNYAPADQVNKPAALQATAVTTFTNRISERSKKMVAKALTGTPQRLTTPNAPATRSSTCEDSLTFEFCQSPPSKRSRLSKPHHPLSPRNQASSLNAHELKLLDDVLNLLPSNVRETSTVTKNISRPLTVKPITSIPISTTSPTGSRLHQNEEESAVTNENRTDKVDMSLNTSSYFDFSDWSLSPPLNCSSPGSESKNELAVSLDRTDIFSSAHSAQGFYRGKVVRVAEVNQLVTVQLQQPLPSKLVSGMEISLKLTGSWSATDLCPGDLVHIVPGTGGHWSGGQFTLTDPKACQPTDSVALDTPACLIHHPDVLISGTNLVGSQKCLRRTLLQQFWSGSVEDEEEEERRKEEFKQDPCVSGPMVMLVGSLVHELFQKLAVTEFPTKALGIDTVDRLLNRVDTLIQLYACSTTQRAMRSVLLTYVDKILIWMSSYCANQQKSNTSRFPKSASPLVRKVHEVEENIWSPKFGLKGKIDLSLLVSVPAEVKAAAQQQSPCLSLIPLELKTGRPTYSVEHIGQVYIYLLLLLDRYGPKVDCGIWSPNRDNESVATASAGWLVYLKETFNSCAVNQFKTSDKRGWIKPNNGCFIGLLQSRNQLTRGLADIVSSVKQLHSQLPTSHRPSVWLPELVEPVKEAHVCQYCPVQLACGLFYGLSKTNKRIPAKSIDSVHNLLSDKCSHLLGEKEDDSIVPALVFFTHWSRLLMLEYINSIRLEHVIASIITESNGEGSAAEPHNAHRQSSERSNPCLRNLILLSSKRVDDGVSMISSRWYSVLEPTIDSTNLSTGSLFQPRDLVLVSSDDGRHVAIALGTVYAVNEADVDARVTVSPDHVVISTDRPLPSWIRHFRLDRHISPKITQCNLSNLVGLMQCSPIGDHLRQLIVNRRPATFVGSLSKRVIESIRHLTKPLNKCQRTAILRVLMANDYVLIKGYPGTGKTQTLAVLLRVLIQLQLKVLVVAHTHSAVDNLLSRLLESGETSLLRLGSTERVPDDLLPYCLEHMVTKLSDSSANRSLPGCEDPVDCIKHHVQTTAVVGCTALAASGGPTLRHLALSPCFDVVLVDEASQLLLPTTLGALLCLRRPQCSPSLQQPRFVLVGDPHQLPPLVQSQQACQAGLSCSLFTYLLPDRTPEDGCTEVSSSVVPLTLQYRMNETILRLPNQLAYRNQMRPANQTVAQSTLSTVADACTNELPFWLRRVVSGHLDDAVLFLDTKQLPNAQCAADHNTNSLEANIIKLIVTTLLKVHQTSKSKLSPSDIGVMAPYRNQVAHIKKVMTDSISGPQVEVNTVDQFQGRDKQVILLSLTVCCEASVNSSDSMQRAAVASMSTTGAHTLLVDNKNTVSTASMRPRNLLLDNLPRLTVALTRARQKLLLIGCSGQHHVPPLANGALPGTVTRASHLDRLFTLVQQTGGHILLSPQELTDLCHS